MTIENWMLKDIANAGVVKLLATVSLNQIREKAAAALKSLEAMKVTQESLATQAGIQSSAGGQLHDYRRVRAHGHSGRRSFHPGRWRHCRGANHSG